MTGVDRDEVEAWIRLAAVPGLDRPRALELLRSFGLPQTIFSASMRTLTKVAGESVARALLADSAAARASSTQAIEWLLRENHHFIPLSDPRYPRALFALTDPPLVVYCIGAVELLNRPTLVMIGSANASEEGMELARQFARALARAEWTIASGISPGIEEAAQRGALLAKAPSVVIQGSGLDRVWPAGQVGLARTLAKDGLLLSEFPPGTASDAARRRQSSRLVAALGRGLIVVESSLRGESVATARMAAELGREVFALPGSIHSPLAKGCHRLIKEGAKLVESARDIEEELSRIRA